MAHPLTPYQETRSHKANRLQGKPLPSSGSALHGNGNMMLDQNVILGVLDTLKGDMPPKVLAYIIRMPHGQMKSLAFLLGQVQNGIDIDWLSDVILSEDPSHQQQPPRPLTPSALVRRHPSVQSGHSQMTDWSGNTYLAPTLGSHESWQLPGCSSTKEIPEENNSLYGALDDGTLYHPYPANYANPTLAFETPVPDKLHHMQPIHSHPSVSVDVDQDLGPTHQYPLNCQSFLLEDEAEPYEGSPKQSVPSSSSNCPGFHEHSPAGFNYYQSFVPTSTSESRTLYSGPTYYRGSQKTGPTTESERALLNKILKTSSMAFIDYQHPQRSKEICRSKPNTIDPSNICVHIVPSVPIGMRIFKDTTQRHTKIARLNSLMHPQIHLAVKFDLQAL
ncbi:hypothetical protein LTS08_002427 [Lithohypha guttulata]|nr:hypothetical protein LTS08_002427 [Lithohypha guttulata]